MTTALRGFYFLLETVIKYLTHTCKNVIMDVRSEGHGDLRVQYERNKISLTWEGKKEFSEEWTLTQIFNLDAYLQRKEK